MANRELEFPHGTYDVWANDDDVIGMTVAKTYPQGWPIVRTEPPFMDAFDESDVGQFLAWCLTNSERLLPMMEPEHDVADLLRRTASVRVTACGTCGGTGTVDAPRREFPNG